MKHLPGRLKGKSKAASIIAMKMYQPSKQVRKHQAPPAMSNLPAVAAEAASPPYARARCQYAPLRQPNAGTSVKKIKKKTMLVLRARIMYTKHRTPIQSRKNPAKIISVKIQAIHVDAHLPKLALNPTVSSP